MNSYFVKKMKLTVEKIQVCDDNGTKKKLKDSLSQD